LTVTLALHAYDTYEEDVTEYDFLENGERVKRGSITTTNNDEQKLPSTYQDQLSEIAGDEEISKVRNNLRTIQTVCKSLQAETKLSFMR